MCTHVWMYVHILLDTRTCCKRRIFLPVINDLQRDPITPNLNTIVPFYKMPLLYQNTDTFFFLSFCILKDRTTSLKAQKKDLLCQFHHHFSSLSRCISLSFTPRYRANLQACGAATCLVYAEDPVTYRSTGSTHRCESIPCINGQRKQLAPSAVL